MAHWTKEHLFELIEKRFQAHRLIVVSNREPYSHVRKNGRIECTRPASGMVSALDPILKASGGVWIAHGSGNADRAVVDSYDRVAVPPEDPSYKLRRVWLPKHIEQEYYYGLANEGLWPLCHIAFQQPTFNQRHWNSYRAANALFAEAVLEEADGQPAIVFIQDYHLALLPAMLKKRNSKLITAQFWHIPWPNRETFRVFPWKEELLDGMLGNDVLGFHLRYHCANFIETVERNVEALVDMEHSTITRGSQSTQVRPFAISIDFDAHNRDAQSQRVEQEMSDWRSQLGPFEYLGIGIDRLDYTKGIPQKLKALDLLLEKHPEYVGKLVIAQVAVPSRTAIADYERLNNEVLQLVDNINAKWGQDSWQPIHFVHRHVEMPALMALHRLADFCVVTSLHDGMNLVAKEFVASRADEDGALVLSEFTGAAREFTGAFQVNPFSIDEIADAMEQALTAGLAERNRRMRQMRAAVESQNIYRWAGKMMEQLLKLEDTPRAMSEDEGILVAGAA